MKRYTYVSDGVMYFLNPEYKVSPGGRVWVTGAEMWNKRDEYVGFWHRHNMPVNLIRDLAIHVRKHAASTPQQVRAYTRKRPVRK